MGKNGKNGNGTNGGGKNGKNDPAGWLTPAVTALRVGAVGPIAGFDADSTPGFSGSRELGEQLLAERGEVLADLQELLYANGRAGDNRSVLLVLQGMDTAGKGGIVRHVGGLLDPQGLAIKGFGKPTPEELEHDFLWRVHKALPPAGRLGIFDRSHYEDVLPVRVHNLVPQSEWEKRYAIINQFEKELVESGTTVIKCALVVSKAEQKARLTERLERPDKYWKYNPGDIDERGFWDDYLQAYQAIFDRCDSDTAPWFLIPANHKWFARLAVCELLISALSGLDLDWPPADFDVATELERIRTLDD
ncbi:polyphosphate kinase 2 family protein [Gordonia sp. NB41Y]|uniref:polyphosphate kinase 2 family protein n=1 Tax=Gordonia sp. NB41Y TaxID=875808 RepID=UPI0002BD4848|nr:polyphosphate kinase 2 family protein [Gordonia sp. NB41Y]WLP89325.1 polyphosphate kinase 2 family protein [Gordonia sp. NB41Y]